MADCAHEIQLCAAGHRLIAGVDEVGRGCWAGPVVAAAVVLPQAIFHTPQLLEGVNDSKALSAAQREQAAKVVHRHALAVGIGATPPYLIDALGIVQATRLAMMQAILSLPLLPDVLLIDALTLPELPLPQQPLIHGDSLSLSIAAASIVAKVTRDRRMVDFDRCYPGYGFASHKGYGTALHTAGLAVRGVTPIHRRSFRPIAELCYAQED